MQSLNRSEICHMIGGWVQLGVIGSNPQFIDILTKLMMEISFTNRNEIDGELQMIFNPKKIAELASNGVINAQLFQKNVLRQEEEAIIQSQSNDEQSWCWFL